MRRLLFLLICMAPAVAGCASENSGISADDPEVTAVAATTSSAVPTTAPATTTTITPTTTTTVATMAIPYTADSGSRLDVHTPSESGPWPVVVVVPGFAQGRMSFRSLAEAIASEGAVVFNISYEYEFPALSGIKDIACAVRFARATAADHGGDPTRVTLVGNSLGASIGAIVAMAGHDFDGDCVATEEPVLVDALVGYEGGFDMATLHPNGDAGDFAALKQEDPELWETIYPYSHIGGNPDLVVRLIHGDDTDVAWYEIPRQDSVEFHRALEEAGYDVELTLVDDSSHIGLTIPTAEAFKVAVRQVMQVAHG